jgi:tRNA(Ile)-lysidine synthase
MPNLIETAGSAINKLIDPQDRVLVAVSGGVDSLALLYVLEQFSKEIGFELFVAHLNHMSRGKESDEDSNFVKRAADKLSLPFFTDSVNINKEKQQLKTSFQESARILRYQFLERTRVSIAGDKIAVGHTADDQIETILMNLLRGAGLKGLSGIPVKRGKIIRPILGCSRTELELYLKDKNLGYREDSSNKEKKYLRNEIRQDLIPYLRKFNNNLSGNLVDMAEIVREEDEWISGKTNDLFAQLVEFDDEARKYSFNILDFQNQALAMKRRLVRETIFQLKGNLRSISTLHVRQVLELFSRARAGSQLKLPGNVRVSCDYGKVNFLLSDKYEDDSVCLPELDKKNIRLKVPGVTSLSGGRLQFYTGLLEMPVELPEPIDEKQAYLDFDKTGDLIHARFYKTGDHFVPLGMQGHKKLSAYFKDQKIPRDKRSLIPILTNSEDDIIWIYGERISDQFRITKNTNKVLFIEGKAS